jgi:hypothetical protein
MYEVIRIKDVLIISQAFNRMIRDDVKYTDVKLVKLVFQLLRIMEDKINTMYSCDFVNRKNNIFRIKAKRICTCLKNITQTMFRNIMYVAYVSTLLLKR